MFSFTIEQNEVSEIIKRYSLTLNPPSTPRLVGGFVRDLLLGVLSHDIDIAVYSISGYSFALGLAEFLNMEKHPHKIMANPEKSKHLETAVLKIKNLCIDFAHLRSEKYTESRIPTINIGTPIEDAERRDITINSLFYNLSTNEIEDFTGKGLCDLKNKIISTPLSPEITLLDDPLRILRIIRFKSKLGFNIDCAIQGALKSPAIQTALLKKVSDERIGIELCKMLEYENSFIGFEEISKIGYIPLMVKLREVLELREEYVDTYLESQYTLYKELTSSNPFFKRRLIGIDFYEEYIESTSMLEREIGTPFITDVFHKDVMLFYMILNGLTTMKTWYQKRRTFINSIIMKESFKLGNAYSNIIHRIEDFIRTLEDSAGVEDPNELVYTGNSIWRISVLLLIINTNDQKYVEMVKKIFIMGVQDCYLEKPLVDGNFLIEKKVDKMEFKNILKKCFICQIKNPKLNAIEIYDLITINK